MDSLVDLRKITIYKIRNEKTDRSYVGATYNGFFGRLAQHVGRLERGDHPNSKFQKEWSESKITDWDFKILEYGVTQQDAKKREEFWIKVCGGLNIMPKSNRERRQEKNMYIALDLKDKNMTYRDIAKSHGVSLGSVARVAHMFELRRRYDLV